MLKENAAGDSELAKKNTEDWIINCNSMMKFQKFRHISRKLATAPRKLVFSIGWKIRCIPRHPLVISWPKTSIDMGSLGETSI